MPSRKPTKSASRAKPVKSGTVTPLASPARRPAPDLEGVRAKFLQALASDGSAPEVAAVVFVHGIGNKPMPSVLKCQWDRALFGAPMGDRTRMSYWVDRDRYPHPGDERCDEGDSLASDAGVGIRALGAPGDEDEGPGLTREQRKAMDSLERRLREALAGDGGTGARVLPGKGVRRWVTSLLTNLFLKDVRDFLYVPEARERMESSVRERLGETPKGPYVVIAHSQGSMIAFEVLRKLAKAECDVRLFVTIGSPLGLQEVQDELEKSGPLAVPSCVDEWVNVANRLDPVALDAQLRDDFAANARGVKVLDLCVQDFDEAGIGGDWGLNPHSATAYLQLDRVRGRVREVCGPAFGNVMGRSILARDLVDALEDAGPQERHATLIQLKAQEGADDAATLAAMRGLLEERIGAFRKASGAPAKAYRVQHMRHFLSADLTRREIEEIRGLSPDLKIERVWRNAAKRALLHQSAQTVQAKPAHLGYGARGKGIGWAVLDTGISAAHPHFATFSNVVAQWDCTRGASPVRIDPGRKGFGDLDGHGHGTHVAATIAGGMRLRRSPGSAETLELDGMAPEAKLYGFKVLKDNGSGEDAYIIKALDAIADLNERAGQLVIHGVNLSLGGNFDPSVFGCGHTPLCQELRRLWRQGVIVVLAAGNEGYAVLESEDGAVPANMDLSIGDPANLEEAIAVGSVHKTNPHTYGVSYFSSRGPTADGRMKPDLVAPGEKILSARHQWKATDTARDLYVEMSGTSMAAPHVSGLLAAFLSARREFSGYPDRVKAILLAHCTDLARDPYIQGRGMPNLVKMLMNT
jgi:subtilisin family serine protease